MEGKAGGVGGAIEGHKVMEGRQLREHLQMSIGSFPLHGYEIYECGFRPHIIFRL